MEEREDPGLLSGGDSEAVVLDGDLPVVPVPFRLHVNGRRFIAAELERVRQQVLQELRELPPVPSD
jgi:hypothetical protein